MRTIIATWVAVFLGAFILQTTVSPLISVLGITPDFLLVALFFFALQTDVLPALLVGFVLGLFQDIYASAMIGQNALAKTLLGFLIGMFNERVMRTDPLIKSILLIFAFLLHDLIFDLVYVFKGITPLAALLPSLLVQTIPRALYSTLLATIIYLWLYFFKPMQK